MQHLADVLDKFGRGVRKQARTRLTKGNQNVNKTLYNSINYQGKVNPNSFEFSIGMKPYGKYQDQGVKGAESTHASAKGSDYAYTNQVPSAKHFVDWVKKRGIKSRDSKGRFAKGGANSIAHAVARSVYKKGIPATKFMSKSIDTEFKRLPDEMVEAYQLDVLTAIKRFTDLKRSK